jgi:hypothetical protein
MSPEREREYAELHAYLDYFSTHISGIDPSDPMHPTNVGRGIVEKYGRSKALEGLKQAVNDTVEELSGKPLEYIRAFDSALHERGLLTFSEARRRYATAYARILKRGCINTETEYYLVAGILADTSSQATDQERARLEQMQSAFQGEA